MLGPSGYDAGKKVVGRKRHLPIDSLGVLLGVIVDPASVQEGDGAELLLRLAHKPCAFVGRTIVLEAIFRVSASGDWPPISSVIAASQPPSPAWR